MRKLTPEQQKRLIRIFNSWGFFPQDKRVDQMTWIDYQRYMRLYHNYAG